MSLKELCDLYQLAVPRQVCDIRSQITSRMSNLRKYIDGQAQRLQCMLPNFPVSMLVPWDPAWQGRHPSPAQVIR